MASRKKQQNICMCQKCAKCFPCIIAFNPHYNPVEVAAALQIRKLRKEILNKLPNITELLSGDTGL
jgi:hypothetical protein